MIKYFGKRVFILIYEEFVEITIYHSLILLSINIRVPSLSDSEYRGVGMAAVTLIKS